MNKKKELIELFKKKGFDKKIILAFEKVPREDFIPLNLKDYAYENTTLPIGYGQTISQPEVVALMLSLLELKKGQKVLELGSGSGYVLALISEIIGKKGKIFGVERIKELAERSKKTLYNLGYKNIQVFNRNGYEGLPEKAPFDRILISAAIQEIPEKILSQLSIKGIFVAPKGPRFEQEIIVIEKKKDNVFEIKKRIPGFLFVPFVND
ncbi:MAG: protein-L-isoaspartate O-methyltransferase [Candidatus Pacearchaeota archaeon]|nr:MAG: protein-L-isoaspartate O-methyltransferase [Candidatus Pacearchaeota archaeon]